MSLTKDSMTHGSYTYHWSFYSMEEKEKKPFGLRAAKGKKYLMEAGDKHYLVSPDRGTTGVDYPYNTYYVPNVYVWQKVILPEEFI